MECLLAGNLIPSTNNSPLLNADIFNFMDFRDNRLSQGLPLMDLPPSTRLPSLEHALDVSPSHMLSDTRCDSALAVSAQFSMTRRTRPLLVVCAAVGAATQMPRASAMMSFQSGLSPQGQCMRRLLARGLMGIMHQVCKHVTCDVALQDAHAGSAPAHAGVTWAEVAALPRRPGGHGCALAALHRRSHSHQPVCPALWCEPTLEAKLFHGLCEIGCWYELCKDLHGLQCDATMDASVLCSLFGMPTLL